MYEYACSVVRVVDGDTVDASVDLGFDVRVKIRFRLLDVNAPELRGVAAVAGVRAKDELTRLLSLGAVIVRSHKPLKRDKYGRWLGAFFVKKADGEVVDVNAALVSRS